MSERPYTNTRTSKDGRWHVVVDTPTVIATPDGAISIAWNGTDEKYRLRAEAVAAEIVDAMNRRALPAADTTALGAVTECGHPFCGMKCGDGDNRPPTPAQIKAAVFAVPEVAEIIRAAKAIFSDDGDYVKQVGDLGFALEAITALEASHDPA